SYLCSDAVYLFHCQWHRCRNDRLRSDPHRPRSGTRSTPVIVGGCRGFHLVFRYGRFPRSHRRLIPIVEPMTFTPPTAARQPVCAVYHGVELVDHWDWLKDPDNPETIAHLEAENAYAEAVTADQQPVPDAIFEEIKSHTVETDMSVPSRIQDWWYFTRTTEGGQYPGYCRGPGRKTSGHPPQVQPGECEHAAQVMLDGNVQADEAAFFAPGYMTISADGNLLAYLVDETGDERFTLRIRDLASGQQLSDEISGLSYGLAFDPAGERLFYLEPDAAWRPYRLKSHRI